MISHHSQDYGVSEKVDAEAGIKPCRRLTDCVKLQWWEFTYHPSLVVYVAMLYKRQDNHFSEQGDLPKDFENWVWPLPGSGKHIQQLLT